MEENKKFLIIGVVILALVILAPIIIYTNKTKNENIIKEVKEVMAGTKASLVYIGRDDCSYCELQNPELSLIENKYGIEYTYVNTNELSDDYLNQLLDILNIDASNYGTPYLVVVKDGEVVYGESGMKTSNELVTYLAKYEVLPSDTKLPIDYIGLEDYNSLIKSTTDEIIVLGQIGCENCLAALPILWELAEEYDLKINYFNLSALTEEEGATFENSLTYLKENDITTPTVLVISNSEAKTYLTGLQTKDSYIQFFKESGFIAE